METKSYTVTQARRSFLWGIVSILMMIPATIGMVRLMVTLYQDLGILHSFVSVVIYMCCGASLLFLGGGMLCGLISILSGASFLRNRDENGIDSKKWLWRSRSGVLMGSLSVIVSLVIVIISFLIVTKLLH